MRNFFRAMTGVMLLIVGMLAGCGSGGSGDVVTPPASGSTRLVASDLTVPATIYAVNSTGYTCYKFNKDGSLLASVIATSGAPTPTTLGAWIIATDNKTLALVITGSPQKLFTLTSNDSSGSSES
jgi:predicted small lipoprotein YifL